MEVEELILTDEEFNERNSSNLEAIPSETISSANDMDKSESITNQTKETKKKSKIKMKS